MRRERFVPLARKHNRYNRIVLVLKRKEGTIAFPLDVGHISDVAERIKVHNDGRGAAWIVHRRPVALVHHEKHPIELKAIARERELKRWTHVKKFALIDRNVVRLKPLATPPNPLNPLNFFFSSP